MKKNGGLIPTVGKEENGYGEDPEILCSIFDKIITALKKEAEKYSKNTTTISCNGTSVTIDFENNSIKIKTGNQLIDKNFSEIIIKNDPKLFKIFTDFFFPQTIINFPTNQ